jgi:hypothetical protein
MAFITEVDKSVYWYLLLCVGTIFVYLFVWSIGLLYIGQREFGATTPEDGKFIWSHLRQILKLSFPMKEK